MPELKGLPGVESGSTPAEFFNKPKEIRPILEDGKAATAAKNNGAINIWATDNGEIRCEAMRYMRILDSKVYARYSKHIEKWATKWLKRIA